jgi:glycosyltransferase involved in cell wall biosynthesis
MNPLVRRLGGKIARRVGLLPPARPSRPSTNGRLAFVGPIPPAATGIASYDRAVLDGLRRIGFLERNRMDIVWPVRRRHRRSIGAYDLAIYQIGNNVSFHGDVYRLAFTAPGLIVLHEVAVDGLVRGLQAMGDAHGLDAAREAAALRSRITGPDIAQHEPLRVVWCAAVSRAARGIVVHSEFCRRYLGSVGVRTPVFTVPHPVVEDEASMRRAEPRARELRSSLEARGARTIVVAPGDINEAKCLPALVEAISTLPPDVHAAIVGRRIPGTDIDATIAAHGLGGRVSVFADVSDEDFRAWLVAADIAVDLRFPHRGEVSGSLSMAMVAGVPTIVSATGTYLDIPEEMVVRIASGPADPSELAARISELRDDPDRRARIGDAARKHLSAMRASDATARGYEEAILATRDLVLDPARQVLARWASNLTELGVDDALVGEGYGTSYARALESFRPPPR